MMNSFDEPLRDDTVELARRLGVELYWFIDAFGAGWAVNSGEVGHDFNADPSGGFGGEVTPWHLAGEPAQLMIRVFVHGVALAKPRGVWVRSTHGFGLPA